MSLLFYDGFDHYSDAQRTASGQWTTAVTAGGATIAITAGIGRSNSGLRFTTFGDTTAYILKTLNVAPGDASFVLGFWYKASTMPGSSHGVCSILDSTTPQVTLTVKADGTLEIRRGSNSGTVLGTTTLSISAGAGHYIVFSGTVGNAGSASIQVDGVTWLTVAGVDTQNTANASWSGIRFGHLNEGQTSSPQVSHDIDDVYLLDGVDGTATQKAAYNASLGDCKVVTIQPTSDGTYSQFLRSTGSTSFALLDESPPTDDTDYVESSTIGDRVSCGYVVPAGGAIRSLWLAQYAKKSDAGTRAVRDFVRISGTDYDGSTDLTLATSYQWLQNLRTFNPASSAAWTSGSVEFGVKVST
jgi:hypothetical protein